LVEVVEVGVAAAAVPEGEVAVVVAVVLGTRR
jgi:hypothetical protein